MPLFTRNTITYEGARLATESMANGKPLLITALAVGNGVLNDADYPETFTSLKSQVAVLPLSKLANTTSTIEASAQISTATLASGFVHTEIGLMSGDTLIAHGYAEPANADYIPSTGEGTAVVKTITMRLKIATASTVYLPAPTENLVSMEEMQTFVSEALPAIVEAKVNISQYQTKVDTTWSKIAGGGKADVSAILAPNGCRRFMDDKGNTIAEFATYGQLISNPGSTFGSSFSLLANQEGINLYRGSTTDGAAGVRVTDAGTQFFQGEANSCTFSLASGHLTYTMPDRSGTLALEVAATHDRLGMVLTGSEYPAKNAWPYHVGVGTDNNGRLIFNLRTGGRLKYTWQNDADHSQGYHLYFDGEDAIADLRDLYNLTVHKTAESDSQANIHSFVLAPVHSPTGTLVSIAWQCRSGSGFSKDQVYLVVMARSELGTVRHVATSKNAQIQVAGKDLSWVFPRAELHGEELIIGLSSEANATEIDTSLVLGVRCSGNPAGENNSMLATNGNNISCLVELTITSGTPLYAPIAHVDNDTLHLTVADRKALANFRYTPNATFAQDDNDNGYVIVKTTGNQPTTTTIRPDSITIVATADDGLIETSNIALPRESGTIPVLNDERLAKLDVAIDKATAPKEPEIETRYHTIEHWGDVVPGEALPKTGGIIHVSISAEAPVDNNVLCSLFEDMPATCQFCHVVIVSETAIVYPANGEAIYSPSDAGKLFAGTIYRHPLYDSGEKNIISNIHRF